MAKYPEFDKRERFEPSIEGAVPSGRIARTRKAVSQKAGCIVGFCHDIWRVE
jgi:hypothetical protein